MTDQEILALFNPTFAGLTPVPEQLPLLAHYTSIQAVEQILRSNEVWLSNPLFMNDLQEMRFGLNEGFRLFSDPELSKKAGGTDERAALLQHAFAHYFQRYDNEEAFDTYIFCLSKHDPANTDGVLSMWRGYGQHGNGAALVFDAAKVTVVPESPFMIVEVLYRSNEDRLSELQRMLDQWADICASAEIQMKNCTSRRMRHCMPSNGAR